MKELDRILSDYCEDEYQEPPGWLLGVVVAAVAVLILLLPFCGWLR